MMLRIDLSNPGIKKAAMAVLFYPVFFLSCFLLEKASPSGPCTPGLGMIFLFLLPFISAIFLIVNAVKLYNGKKENKKSALVHLMALITYLLFFYINTNS